LTANIAVNAGSAVDSPARPALTGATGSLNARRSPAPAPANGALRR